MSKSILVIDMPKSCSECKMLYRKRNNKREVYRCQILKTNLQVDKIDNRCPLKPLPKKVIRAFDVKGNFKDGWNMCLDEILGGEE